MARLSFKYLILGASFGFCALLNFVFFHKNVNLNIVLAVNEAFLLFFVLSLFYLYRSISRPIASLLEAVRQSEKGDYSSRVESRSDNEIDLLIESFNRLMVTIQKITQDVHRSETLKSDFISTISHELRTPLTSISGYTKLISAGDAGPVTPTQKEFLDIIDYNVERLMELINDFLDFQQMETGKINLDLKSHNLMPLLEECLATFQVVAQKKNLKMELKGSKEEALVSGDRHRLTQIFMNLLSNAVKYTPRGSVNIEVEKSDYSVAIRVRDSGLGMSQEEQERLFQKFYRTLSGLSSGEKGSGLGLMIVKKLVDIHGGSISVESAPGAGSVFSVQFPLATPETISAPKTVREFIAGMGWKILLADSNEDLRILLRRELEKRGMHVDDLDRGHAVLKQIENEHYDLVLIDMHLRDVPGVDVLKVIHRSPQHHSLPVVMMSSEEKDLPSISEFSSWGLSKFIPKYRGLTYVADHVNQFLEDQKLLEQHH